MKRTVLIASLFVCFLMLICSISYPTIAENEIKNNPTVSVRGGFGITILVQNLDENTPIVTTVEDAYLWGSNSNKLNRNSFQLHLNIIDIQGDSLILHVNIGENKFSYECDTGFIFFVWDIVPLDS